MSLFHGSSSRKPLVIVYIRHKLLLRSHTGDMAIRVDLVFIGPPMIFITVIGFIVFIKGYSRV